MDAFLSTLFLTRMMVRGGLYGFVGTLATLMSCMLRGNKSFCEFLKNWTCFVWQFLIIPFSFMYPKWLYVSAHEMVVEPINDGLLGSQLRILMCVAIPA